MVYRWQRPIAWLLSLLLTFHQIGSGVAVAQVRVTGNSLAVPFIEGQSATDAKAAIEASGLVAKFRLGQAPPTGAQAFEVYAVEPSAGTQVARGQTVVITIYDAAPATDLTADNRELRGVQTSTYRPHPEAIIDPISGRVSISTVDLDVGAGPIELPLRRSLRTGSAPAGLLGTRWRLNWENRLVRGAALAAIEEEAGAIVFQPDPDGDRFRSARGDVLVFLGEEAVRTTPQGVRERYDAKGRLVERDERNGNKITLQYDAGGRLTAIAGPFRASLQLVTDQHGRLVKARSSSGQTVHYDYGGGTASQDAGSPDLVTRYDYNSAGALARVERQDAGATGYTYDSAGRVTSREWADGTREQYQYDDQNLVRRHIDPAGRVTTIKYQPEQRRCEIDAPSGKSIVEFDPAGRASRITGPTGQVARLEYDALGRMTLVESPATVSRFEYQGDSHHVTAILSDGAGQVHAYDERQNLTSITDSQHDCKAAEFDYRSDGLIERMANCDGQEWTFDYDDVGRLQRATDALGNARQFQYDGHGNLLRETDPLGGVTTRLYDTEGRIERQIDPSGATTRYEYDTRGLLCRETDPGGGVTQFEYDQRGRLVAEIDPLGRVKQYRYDPDGQLKSITDAAGATNRFDYDAAGNLIRETNALGGASEAAYDELGRLAGLTDVAGRTLRWEYSARGGITRLSDSSSGAVTFEYDEKGRLIKETDSAGNATRREYNQLGQLVRVVPASGHVVQLDYDDAGRVVSVRKGDASTTQYRHDLLGRLVKETRAGGREISYDYDALGNLLAWRDNLGAGAAFRYDANGRPVEFTDSTGAKSRLRYDPHGNLVASTDPLGHVQHWSYDAAGQLVEVIEPNGDRVKYAYDAGGNITEVLHPGGGESRFAYDALGNPIRCSDPIDNTVSFTYDFAGNLTSRTDAKGQTSTFHYDAHGRLIRKEIPDKKPIHYRYDRLGHLVQVDDGVFPVRYEFDARGNRTSIEYPTLKRKLGYEYDDAGRLSRFVDSEGRAIAYEYDADDRLLGIATEEEQRIEFDYDARNRLASTRYSNGVTGTRKYDTEDRLVELAYTAVDGKVVSSWKYAYDAAGNCIRIEDAKGRINRYRYDPSGQLVEEDRGVGGLVTYDYLPGGNRRRRTADGRTTEYRYDQADRLLEAADETFRYDANGNLIERRSDHGATRYEYDAENRLTAVRMPDGTGVSYGYAATGERIWRRDAKGLTHFVTDGVNLLAELDENLECTASYLHGPGTDRPLTLVRDGRDFCYLTDALGSVMALADAAGKPTVSYAYDAFGALLQADDGAPHSLTFTARYWESDVRLFYCRARFYDPELGRFLGKDPLLAMPSQAAAANPYHYAWNNPIRFTDPTGTTPQVVPHRFLNSEIHGMFEPPSSLYPEGRILVAESVYHGSDGMYRSSIIEHEMGHWEQFVRRMQVIDPGGTYTPNQQGADWNNYYKRNQHVLEMETYQRQISYLLERGRSRASPLVTGLVRQWEKAAGLIAASLPSAAANQALPPRRGGGMRRGSPGTGSGLRGPSGRNRQAMVRLPTVPSLGNTLQTANRAAGAAGLVLMGANIAACLKEGGPWWYCAGEAALGAGVFVAVSGAVLLVTGPAGPLLVGGGGAILLVAGTGPTAARVGEAWAEEPIPPLQRIPIDPTAPPMIALAPPSTGQAASPITPGTAPGSVSSGTLAPPGSPVVTGRVPNVVGHTVASARTQMAQAGLTAEFLAAQKAPTQEQQSRVYAQTPAPGTLALPGLEVEVLYYAESETAPTEMIEVPSLVGKSASAARQLVLESKLEPAFKLHGTPPVNQQEATALKVTAQQPLAGKSVPVASEVTLTISTTPSPPGRGEPEPPASPTAPTPKPLIGSYRAHLWKVVGIPYSHPGDMWSPNSRDPRTRGLPPTPVTLTFDANGGVTGYCAYAYPSEKMISVIDHDRDMYWNTSFQIEGSTDWQTGEINVRLLNGHIDQGHAYTYGRSDPNRFLYSTTEVRFEAALRGYRTWAPQHSAFLEKLQADPEAYHAAVGAWTSELLVKEQANVKLAHDGWLGISGVTSGIKPPAVKIQRCLSQSVFGDGHGGSEDDRTDFFQQAANRLGGGWWYLQIIEPATEEGSAPHELSGFGVEPKSVRLEVGQSYRFKAVGSYSDRLRLDDLTANARWVNGPVFTATRPGEFTVTAFIRKADNTLMSDNATVTVVKPVPKPK